MQAYKSPGELSAADTLTDPDRVIPMPRMAPPTAKRLMCLVLTQFLKVLRTAFRWSRVTGNTAITMNPDTPIVSVCSIVIAIIIGARER